MIRGSWLVAALAVLALVACGPQESDASQERPHKPGEPRVSIRPAKPRDTEGTPPVTQPKTAPKPDPNPVTRPAPKPDPKPAPKSAPKPAPQPKPGPVSKPDPTPPPDDGIPRAEINFGAGRAGILKAEQLEPDLETYPYESSGTFASVGLSKRLLDQGRAEVSVIWKGEPKRMFAVDVTDSTITLTPHSDPNRARQALSFMPLVEGAEYLYQGKGGAEDVTYVLRTQRIGFVKWQYMAQLPADGGSETLAAEYLCRGAFQKGADGVIFLEAKSIADLNRSKPGPRQVLLKLPPREGWSTRLSYDGGTTTFQIRVDGFESVTVPAGTFENAARIRIEPEQGFDPGRTCWLAPGVGLIKVAGDAGRGMELKSYRYP
jgi:hypothetical protein